MTHPMFYSCYAEKGKNVAQFRLKRCYCTKTSDRSSRYSKRTSASVLRLDEWINEQLDGARTSALMLRFVFLLELVRRTNSWEKKGEKSFRDVC